MTPRRRWPIFNPEPTRWSPGRTAHQARRRRQKPGDPCRAGLHQGPDRNPGRRLAACRACWRARSPASRWSISAPAAGGKTLALAAAMENQGPDLRHRYRQAPARADPCPARTRRRAQCAGAPAARSATKLDDLAGRIDLVLIDAPCTGTGSWRRNPDAKWRMRPGALEQRMKDQAATLDRAVRLLKAGGPHRLCHLLGAGGGERRRRSAISSPASRVCRRCRRPKSMSAALGERAYLFRKAALLTERAC